MAIHIPQLIKMKLQGLGSRLVVTCSREILRTKSSTKARTLGAGAGGTKSLQRVAGSPEVRQKAPRSFSGLHMK